MKGRRLGLREAIHFCRWPTPLSPPPSFLALLKEHILHWRLQLGGEDNLTVLQTWPIEIEQNHRLTTKFVVKFHRWKKKITRFYFSRFFPQRKASNGERETVLTRILLIYVWAKERQIQWTLGKITSCTQSSEFSCPLPSDLSSLYLQCGL